jgi:hypothetical protein
MRSIYRTALTTLALVLATSAVAASGAYAAPEWYTSSTPAAAEWQQAGKALSESRATALKGRMAVTDQTQEVTVECEIAGEGTIGVGATGKVTSLTPSKCISKTANCTKLEKVIVTGTPWSSELVYSRGTARDAVKGETALGLQFTCTISGFVKLTDKCTVAAISTTTENVVAGVNSAFSSEAACKLGSLNDKGSIEGNELTEATTGGKLEVAGKEGPFTKLSSSLEAKSAGKLTIEDQGWKLSVTCQVQTAGTIEAAGKGAIKSYFVSGCETSGCTSLGTVTAINLPWKTELHESVGVIDESILSGGNGTPQWRFSCVVSGSRVEDTCNLNVSPRMLNGPLGNVDALFGEGHVNCSLDGRENEGAWRGELAVEHPASVAEIAVK